MNAKINMSSGPEGNGYNDTLVHPTVRATVNHLARKRVKYNSDAFIRNVALLERFPEISVSDLMSALKSAGVNVSGFHAEISEIEFIKRPFLAFLKQDRIDAARVELIQVEKIGRRKVTLSEDRFGTMTMSRDELMGRWSGVVLSVEGSENASEECELVGYRSEIRTYHGVLTSKECRDLIAYCDNLHFTRSRVLQRRNDILSDIVQAKFRSSSSVVLWDRGHPLLRRLYAMIAKQEGVSEEQIETIQCVRYKRGQRFRPHYDGGVDLPRLTTYLLYLNDDFTGGETYFPMLGHLVAPTTGSCLRFPSCYHDGRIRWQSEHGGLPVKSGVKYALNIWVHCPKVHSSVRSTRA